MFERRLKIFLLSVVALTILLVLRALQLQVIQGSEWRSEAGESLKRVQWTETVRGTIRDIKGRELAVDRPSLDVRVAYQVITREPDAKWVRNAAIARLSARAEKVTKDSLAAETAAVRADIEGMWTLLGTLPGQTHESIEDARRDIVQRVEMRRRYLWYYRYRAAVAEEQDKSAEDAWYKRWVEEGDGVDLDKFNDLVADEQLESHVIVPAITAEVNNRLLKQKERLPGLEIRPSTHRHYPEGDAGCHVVGHLSRISKEDLDAKVNDDLDDSTRYRAYDLIGRGGLEALCEPALRGKRGKTVTAKGDGRVLERTEAQRGQDVVTTIDIALQRQIQKFFEDDEWHGAGVVIDVPTGEVRALASYPTYDPNRFDELYAKLADDDVNAPLFNRATQAQLEPGSTVKPLVGMAAIASGLWGPGDTIACDGWLYLGRRRMPNGRCWTQKMGILHGPLDFEGALERSCNIYFEVAADRMGMNELSGWMSRFGLGRPTGIGITEATGRVPKTGNRNRLLSRMDTCFVGIGQGEVAATPLQIANLVATIARDGQWKRPRIVPTGTPVKPTGNPVPDTMDLGLSPAVVQHAQNGMVRVVNAPHGTGHALRRDDIVIAGKTGTAQAASLMVAKRDENGRKVKDENGRVVLEPLPLMTPENPKTATPWYRGFGGKGQLGYERNHAWFMGYAPANNPRIAFAVLVEYGGGGGTAAAPIAQRLVEACVEHGYLPGITAVEAR